VGEIKVITYVLSVVCMHEGLILASTLRHNMSATECLSFPVALSGCEDQCTQSVILEPRSSLQE
jgi:hypothetical protein